MTEHLLYVRDCSEEAMVKETGSSSPLESFLGFRGECSGEMGRGTHKGLTRIYNPMCDYMSVLIHCASVAVGGT